MCDVGWPTVLIEFDEVEPQVDRQDNSMLILGRVPSADGEARKHGRRHTHWLSDAMARPSEVEREARQLVAAGAALHFPSSVFGPRPR